MSPVSWRRVLIVRAGERGGERGSATAEFAVALPAAMVVLVACIGGLQLAGLQLRLQDAAAVAARAAGRGESPATVAARLSGQTPGASVSRSTTGDLVCVRVSASARFLTGIILSGESCAPVGGK